MRSFYKEAQKSPFKFFPWKTGNMHFKFLPVRRQIVGRPSGLEGSGEQHRGQQLGMQKVVGGLGAAAAMSRRLFADSSIVQRGCWDPKWGYLHVAAPALSRCNKLLRHG